MTPFQLKVTNYGIKIKWDDIFSVKSCKICVKKEQGKVGVHAICMEMN
jgi:hypothetical protein